MGVGRGWLLVGRWFWLLVSVGDNFGDNFGQAGGGKFGFRLGGSGCCWLSPWVSSLLPIGIFWVNIGPNIFVIGKLTDLATGTVLVVHCLAFWC